MVYGAVSHEATSESTFSGAGRAFNKARTLVGSTTLCDSIVVSSGEKRHAATAAEVCAAYRDRRKRRRLDVDDESASSSFPASPVNLSCRCRCCWRVAIAGNCGVSAAGS